MNYRQKIGRYGEELAVSFLTRHGYKILNKNTRIGNKEIDIIANINDKLVFIEVKTVNSKHYGPAEENIGRRKINNLLNALKVHIAKYDLDPENGQLDLITIDIHSTKKTASIKHYKDIY